MIFYFDEPFEKKESHKERNLYYKIFAGYLFNELVPGLEERKDRHGRVECEEGSCVTAPRRAARGRPPRRPPAIPGRDPGSADLPGRSTGYQPRGWSA